MYRLREYARYHGTKLRNGVFRVQRWTSYVVADFERDPGFAHGRWTLVEGMSARLVLGPRDFHLLGRPTRQWQLVLSREMALASAMEKAHP